MMLGIFPITSCTRQASKVYSVRLVSGDPAAVVHQQLQNLTAEGFSGVVLVDHAGSVVLSAGYGLANRERNIPFTVSTVSDIGSLTKQFTATAILDLWHSGKLNLSDPVSAYFPEVQGADGAVTIHQLLTHSAGLPLYCGDDFDRVTRQQLIDQCVRRTSDSPPGEKYIYSNAGYGVLAAIVEVVSGKLYEEYLLERFFQPLGMHLTGYSIAGLEDMELAIGYKGWRRWGTTIQRLPSLGEDFWALKGNGGIHSTAEDMYLWFKALRDGGLLSDKVREQLFIPHMVRSEGSAYGYGWGVHQLPDSSGRQISHSGNNDVFYAQWLWFPEQDLFIYIMTNNSKHTTGTVARLILKTFSPG